MNRFQPGDIVRCFKDQPYGANINKGELAIIISCNENGHIHFDNHPSGVLKFHWSGSADDFELENLVEANE